MAHRMQQMPKVRCWGSCGCAGISWLCPACMHALWLFMCVNVQMARIMGDKDSCHEGCVMDDVWPPGHHFCGPNKPG